MMVTLANGFADRGLQVDLVLAKAEGPYLTDVSPSVRVVDLRASRVLASLPGLVRYLRRERPTALLSAMSHANVVAAAARWLARVPMRLVVSEHNTYSVANAAGKSSTSILMPSLMRLTYAGVDSIVAVSQGAAADLAAVMNLPSKRVQTIYNPVVTDTMLARSRQPVEHPWFGADEPPVILGIGRLTAQKNFSLLIRAFAQLHSQRNMRLMILGEGELRSELEALINKLGLEEDVALLGFVNNPYAYLRQSAMFALSSVWEGLPTVLIEAMACGVRVVSTDCPSGPSEILENGKWGRLVPMGDVDALAKAIAETLDDLEHPDVAKRAAYFSINRAVEAYLSMLLINA